MTNTKFEKLIDLYINEDIERAEQLFHEIVVEKSREIYESMMDEDGDMSADLMAEVEADETAMEADEDFEDTEDMIVGDEDDIDADMDDVDADMDDMEDDEDDMEFGDDDMEDMEADDEDLEDRVVDLEDKLEELMAEFEDLMADEGAADEEEVEAEAEDEDEVMESVQLTAVKAVHGDDGAQKVSPVAKSKKIDSNGASAVTFSQGEEKGRAAPSVETVKGDFKNTPAQKGNFSEKGEKAPAPKKEVVKSVSPVAESKRTAKRRI